MRERTCIACRKKGGPEQFFRMVAGPGEEVYAELGNRLPGRGAYCCFSQECMNKVFNPRILERTLRSRVVAPEVEGMAGTLRTLLKNRLAGLLGSAWRKGVVAAGRDAAFRSMRSEKEGCLFLAEDLSPGSRKEIDHEAACAAVALKLTMSEVGEVFGRRPVGVFFVADVSLSHSVALRNSQVRSLGNDCQ